MSQNIWELRGRGLERQRRRAEAVKKSLKGNRVKRLLDLGCAEGYVTSYLERLSELVVGIDLDMNALRGAKKRVTNGEFINASVAELPVRDGIFDTVCILETLEHLPDALLAMTIKEIDRVSTSTLVVSVPYKEKISYVKCVHCNELTPLYGHLRSLDENKVSSFLPARYTPVDARHLPNLEVVSCSKIFAILPFPAWSIFNTLLGRVRKGYWILMKYSKNP